MVEKLIQSVRWTCCLIVVSGIVTVPVTARGEESIQPVAVLSIAPSEQLMEDVRYLTQVAGRPDASSHLQLLVAPFLDHLDPERPAGVLVTIEENKPKGIGFLPVSDGQELLAALQSKRGTRVDDLGNGVMKLRWGKGAYLKQQGKWLYFTDQLRNLSDPPKDPVALLDGLNHEYDVAFRLFVRNIPQGLKDVADFTLQTKIDAAPHAGANSELDAAFSKSWRRDMKQTVSTLINASDQITMGWAVDRGERRTYLDLQAQVKKGTPLSRELGALMDNRSTFTGFFMEEAAVACQGSVRIPKSGQERIGSFLGYLREKALRSIDADPNAPKSVNEIVNNVLNVIDQTVREGETDMGASLVLAPETFKFVGGARVADGHALADAFQKLFELAKHEPEVPRVNFHAKKYKHLDLHTLSLPIAEHDQDARKLLGNHVDITIATGPEQLFVALGKESGNMLETIVDQCLKSGPQKVPPLDLRIALEPVMNYLASIKKENSEQQTLAKLMKQARGGDAIRLKVHPIDSGIGCRLEVEEGALKLLGQASHANHDG